MVILVGGAFRPALDNGFVGWDDPQNFLSNPLYRGLGRAQLRWALTTTHLGVYQPVAWLLLSAQWVVWRMDPRGYHLTSPALHSAVVLAVYGVTREIVARALPGSAEERPMLFALCCAFAAARFAVHPLRVEVVAWASCQPYLPCALFSAASIWMYLRAPDRQGRGRAAWLAGSAALFALAGLSKAAAVSLPAVMLLLDVYPLRRLSLERPLDREGRHALVEKLPILVIALAVAASALWARSAAATPSGAAGDPWLRALGAGYGVIFYLLKIVVPIGVSPYYPVPHLRGATLGVFLAASTVVLGLSAALVKLRQRRPGLLASWIAFLVLLAPGLAAAAAGTGVIAADRYCYLASAALGCPLAAALYKFCRLGPRPSRNAAGAALAGLLVLVGLTDGARGQCRIWHDSLTLWSYAVGHGADNSAEARYNLGLAHAERGDLPEARVQFAEALRLDPDNLRARNNLAYTLTLMGRAEEAILLLEEALRRAPRNATVHHSLAEALNRAGRLASAVAHYREAARLRPDSTRYRADLAAALKAIGATRDSK